MSYKMAGKNGVPLSHSDRRLGLGSYVHCDTSSLMFDLETVRLLRGFQ
jgi:hypothetical protein